MPLTFHYLVPVRRPICTEVTAEVDPVMLPDVGTSWAQYLNCPEVFGLKTQVAVWVPETFAVNRPTQPGIFFVPE